MAKGVATGLDGTGNGKGDKIMVVLPYKDRLELFFHLQQLVMESLGNEKDRAGNFVNQGIAPTCLCTTTYRLYEQTLFAALIDVLRDRHGNSMMVEPNVTSGDFSASFTRERVKAL